MIRDSNSLWDFTTPFVPTFRAYNEAAIRLTNQLHDQIGLPRSPAKEPKYSFVVASAIASFQSVMCYEAGYLYWPMKQDRYSAYDQVGRVILVNVQEALADHGLIKLVQKGGRVFTKHKNSAEANLTGGATFRFKNEPTLWEVNEDIMHLDDFWDAEFQDVGRPSLVVGEIQSRADKYYAKLDGRQSAKIPTSELEKKFEQDGWEAWAGIPRLQSYWEKSPLTFQFYKGNNTFIRHASSASRIFSNGSITKGGRYYGMWSNLDKRQRLRATINHKPTVQIDIKASQPTLLSGFLGKKMNVGDTWTDVYGLVVNDLHKDMVLRDVPTSELKDKVKLVIMQMIGTGNPNKWKPAKTSEHLFRMKPFMVLNENSKKRIPVDNYKNEFSLIAYYCKKRIPALWDLEAGKYDSEFLSFHESQILTWTMHLLLEPKISGKAIVTYPMHDCLIVPKEDEDVAVEVMRWCIRQYTCREFKTHFMFDAALSVEEAGQKDRILEGRYFN